VANAPARSEKAELSAPLRDAAPQPVAEKRSTDATTDPKAAVNSPATVQRDLVAANEVGRADAILPQRAVDSISASRVARRSAFDPPLQQGAASQSQQSLRQRAAESSPAAPLAATGAGARLGSAVATGAAANTTNVVGCYRLQRSTTQGGGPTIVADSVQLFVDAIPERSDPTWYRARAAGLGADTSLAWRLVDSTTVELRSRVGSPPLAVRFSTAGLPLPLAPEAGVRAVVAVRIRCP
jgi:hypothetical protein